MRETYGERRFNPVSSPTLMLAVLLATPAQAQLTFQGAVYHEATRTSYATNPIDNGGALFVFVRNDSPVTQTFTSGSVLVNGQAAASYGEYDWSRVWPIAVAPGESTTLTLKGNGGVFALGQNVDVTLTSDTGGVLTRNNIPLSTPKLRVANVIPSRDLTKVNVYLRNDDHTPYTINSLYLNEDVTSQSRFVGGGTTIAPNSVKIVEVDFGQLQQITTPYAVRVEATRSVDLAEVTTGAPIRLTEAILPTGSWQADLATNEGAMRDARLQYGHELHGATSRFPSLMDSRTEKYSIRGLNIDVLDFPNGDLNKVEYRDFTTGVPGGVPHEAPLFQLPTPVAAQVENPSIYGWYVRDEPDLNTSSPTRNPQAMWRLNDTFWRNSSKPTFLNLVADGSVQRYGLISDHPAIDRYMQEAPLADSRGNRNIDQVLQYADSMKENVEPLRMWWITQGVSDAWGGDQPTDWGIDVQFWSSIMGGAKGVIGFMFDNREATHPALHARQVEVTHELQTVSNLVLYGEPIANTTLTVGGTLVDQEANDITAAARSLVSEHAVVLPVANLTGRQSFFGSPAYDVLNNVSVTVEIPEWIAIDQVKRVTATGFQDLGDGFSFSRNGQTVSITMDVLNDTDVFIISEADVLAPAQVENLRLVDGSFLSWDEPFDNFGVHGYEVLENGSLIATVNTPMHELAVYNPSSQYQVRAFDASLNFGGQSVPLGSIVSRWDGSNPLAGEPGDGMNWNDNRNWTRDGQVDAGFMTNTIVTFTPASGQPSINLQGNRVVTALNFQGSYALQGFTLTVATGEIAVQEGASARISSTLATAADSWQKLGPGILRHNGALSKDLRVVEGVYAGTSTNQNVEVEAGAVLQPGDSSGLMRVNGTLVMKPDSRLRIGIPASGQAPGLLTFGNVNVQAGAVLEIVLGGFQPASGYERQIVTLLGGGELIGAFNLALPEIGSELAWVVDQDPVADNITIAVVKSADFNRDQVVNGVDLGIWQANFGTSFGAAQDAGDANGDGRVNGRDFLAWQRQFDAVGSAAAASLRVPEPGTRYLFLVAALSFQIWSVPRARRQ